MKTPLARLTGQVVAYGQVTPGKCCHPSTDAVPPLDPSTACHHSEGTASARPDPTT
jgi:hypothetical protein